MTGSLVLEALSTDLAKTRSHPADCLAKFDLVGDHKLRFVSHVSSSGAELTSSRWRFYEIIDGTALPKAAIRCMESLLGGPRTIPAPEGHQFVNYSGPLYETFAASIAPKSDG